MIDFVARIDHRHHQVVDRLLGARRDQDLRPRVLERIVASELGRDRVLELGDALDRGVAREAAADRRHARVRNVYRRIEVGLADTEADDVASLGLEPRDAAGQGDGGRGLDAC